MKHLDVNLRSTEDTAAPDSSLTAHTPNTLTTCSQFSGIDFDDLRLNAAQLRFVLALPTFDFNVDIAVRQSYTRAHWKKQSAQIMSRPKIQRAVARIRNHIEKRAADATSWTLEQSVADAKSMLDTCGRAAHWWGCDRIRYRAEREELEVKLMDMDTPADEKSAITNIVATLFEMETAANSEIRKWIQRMEFWKDNLDTICGHKKSNIRTTGEIFIGDIRGLSDADAIRIAAALSRKDTEGRSGRGHFQ